MQTKFNIGDIVGVLGEITHIDIDDSGISYTVHIKDIYGSSFNIGVLERDIGEIANGSETR